MEVLGTLAVFLTLVALAAAWVFFTFPPAYADKKKVKVFNMTILAVSVMLSFVYLLDISMWIKGPQVADYRMMFSLVGVAGIFSAMFIVMFLVRNFYIFRQKRGFF